MADSIRDVRNWLEEQLQHGYGGVAIDEGSLELVILHEGNQIASRYELGGIPEDND